MNFEERAKKVIAELTEEDINVLKDTQNLMEHSNRLEEIVGRIFDFDYSDSNNYDKIKEIFPDIEDISQDGEVWSKSGLDIEIPQITDDGHTVNLWLGLYAEPQLLDDDKGITSPITLQFSLETVYDNHSEPWHIITRCVPLPNDKETKAMQFFTKSQTPIEIRLRFDFGQDLSHSEIDEDRRELYKDFDTFKKCLYKPEEAEGLDPNTKYLDRVYIGTPYNSGKAFELEEFWEDDKGNVTGKTSFPNCPFSENGTYEIETGYDLPDCTRYYEDGNLLYDYMYEAYSKTEEYAKEIATLTKANVSVEKDNKAQNKGENR